LLLHGAENVVDAAADGVGGAVAAEAVPKHAGIVEVHAGK